MKRLLGLIERMLGNAEHRTDDEARVILESGERAQDRRLARLMGLPAGQVADVARQAARREELSLRLDVRGRR